VSRRSKRDVSPVPEKKEATHTKIRKEESGDDEEEEKVIVSRPPGKIIHDSILSELNEFKKLVDVMETERALTCVRDACAEQPTSSRKNKVVNKKVSSGC